MAKLVCSVCGSTLKYKRIDDGEIIIEIDTDTSIIEKSNWSDGSTEVYCSKDNSHKISPELFDAVQELVEGFGY